MAANASAPPTASATTTVFASQSRVDSMPNANAIINTTAAMIAPPWNPPPGEPLPWKVIKSP